MLDGSMRAGQDVIDGRTLASVRGNTGVGDGILGFDDIAYALQAGCDPLAEDSSYRAAGRGWPSASSCCRMASACPAEKRAAGALADRGDDGCMRQTVRPMVRIVSGKAETKICSYD